MADPVASRVVLATRNAGKIAELSRILDAAGFADGLVGLDTFPGAPDVAETGLTFADNALLKARAIAAYTGLPAVADDSGLCVDALHGMPGVFSARWSGKHGDDRANLDLVLGQLADVAARGAQFACVAALCLPPGAKPPGDPQWGDYPSPHTSLRPPEEGRREWTTTGVLAGSLTRAPRGTNGFGYDPIFVPEGMTVTTAELPPEEKDAISHRGRAFRAIAPVIAAQVLKR
ncbi:MAG TPA: non-canonical purine NTP pyrophosphatase [Trebonia sp.]|nr:non-canonical purine NTP pyrophosphatase [Trebonia sp.]